MAAQALSSISGPTSVPASSGLPTGTDLIGLLQARHELVVNAVMHKQAAQRRAALACRAHGGEGDAAQRQIEIGGRANDRGIVAAELENGASKALREAWTNGSSHRG